jgi:Sec-independent protein translocase protein TatA
MRFIFYIVLFYLLYKLIFDFVIPVSKATRQIKKNFRNVQEQQQQYYQQQQQTKHAPQSPPEKKTPPSDPEYIDFEEVK